MKRTVDTISIIGTGNVGSHLAKSLVDSGVQVSHIYSRDSERDENFASSIDAILVSSIDDLPEQLTLICINDDQIDSVVAQIDSNTPIAYTSGSVTLGSLPQRDNIGVFYPLQTFSKERAVVSDIPFLIEANNQSYAEVLADLARRISPLVSFADSAKRKELHLAAVWINNFTNHIVHIAQKYAKEQELDISLLTPLLKETVAKLDNMSALDAQTGPARRGDINIINDHLEQLDGLDKELYALISASIKKTYSKNEEL